MSNENIFSEKAVKGNHIFNALDKDLDIGSVLKDFKLEHQQAKSFWNSISNNQKLVTAISAIHALREPANETTDKDFNVCYNNSGYKEEYTIKYNAYAQISPGYDNSKEYGDAKNKFISALVDFLNGKKTQLIDDEGNPKFGKNNKPELQTNADFFKKTLLSLYKEMWKTAVDQPLYNFLVKNHNKANVAKRWTDMKSYRSVIYEIIIEEFNKAKNKTS